MNTPFAKSLRLPCMCAVLLIAGCESNDDYRGDTPSPPAAQSFTDWSKRNVFAKDADTLPEAVDIAFNFDGDDNQSAYAELLPPTS